MATAKPLRLQACSYLVRLQVQRSQCGTCERGLGSARTRRFPTARAAMVAQFKKHQQQAQGAQSYFLADSLLSASSMQKQELPAKPEPHKLNPEWLEELLDAADLVISNDTFKTEEEHRDLSRYVANLSKLANAVRQSPASLLAGLVPAAYADLQALK